MKARVAGRKALHVSCQSCCYWDANADLDDEGECRRFPPKLFDASDDGDGFGLWPFTAASSWCGEWKSKAG